MKRNTTIQLADIPLPPSEMLERQVIADAISNPDMLGEVSLIISEDSFTDDNRKYLWNTIMWMYSNRKPIDIVSVWQIAGKIYMDEIQRQYTEASSASAFLSHASLLHVAETKRRAYFAALTIVQQSASSQTSEEDIFSAADELSREIQGERHITSESSLDSVLATVADETEQEQQEAMQGRSVRISTSIPSLDFLLYGGFGRGQLIILAARPSVGKTALMLQFAKTAARNGTPATIFSLEMTKSELGKRLLFSTDGLTQKEITGKDVKWEQFEAARASINSLPLYINDESRSLSAISSRITSAVNQGKCGIAFIDYLGLMRFEQSSQNTLAQQIGFVTNELKNLAKRLRIPIVLLCQLNRDYSKESGNSAPQLYHLRDSGNIEQDADVVLMLASSGPNLDVWVRKNRNYKRDLKITLMPNNTYSRFTEVTPEWAKNEGYYTPTPLLTEYDFDNDNQDF